MFGDNARSLFRRHFNVCNLFPARLEHFDDRLVLADADAARLGDEHAVQVAPGDLFGKGVQAAIPQVAMPTTTRVLPLSSARMPILLFTLSLRA